MATTCITLAQLATLDRAGLTLPAAVLGGDDTLHHDPACPQARPSAVPLANELQRLNPTYPTYRLLHGCGTCGPVAGLLPEAVVARMLTTVGESLSAAEAFLRHGRDAAAAQAALHTLVALRADLDPTVHAGGTTPVTALEAELADELEDLAAVLGTHRRDWQHRLRAALATARDRSAATRGWLVDAGHPRWVATPKLSERLAAPSGESPDDLARLVHLRPLAVGANGTGWAQLPANFAPAPDRQWAALGPARPGEGADLARAAAALADGGLGPAAALEAARAVLLAPGAEPAPR